MARRVAGGAPGRDDAGLFGVFAERWLESSRPESSRKETTKILYAGLTRNHVVGSDLGRLPMKRPRPTSVERFVTQPRAKGLSDSTVRQVYTIARAIADDAVRDGLMATNPFATIRRPKVTAAEARFLEAHQILRLLESAGDSRYGPLFEFLVHTGLRRGEALALTLGRRRPRPPPHPRPRHPRPGERPADRAAAQVGEVRRTIPLSDPAADALSRVRARSVQERDLAAQLWVDSRHVFVTDIGEPCDPRNALRALTVAAQRAGLEGVGCTPCGTPRHP